MKPLSHVYVANAVINDVVNNNGKVRIGNLGLFDIYPEFKAALLDPAKAPYFRAGAVGPDAFPSLLTGQTQVHPHTDKWLAYVDRKLHTTATSTAAKGRNAFFAGYLSHICADIWTHDWVNCYSGGPWPAFSDLGTPDAIRNISIHLAIETIMDRNVETVKPSMSVSIAVPTTALVDLMVNTKRVPVLAPGETLQADDIACSTFFEDGFMKKYWYTQQYLGASATNPVASYLKAWHKDLKTGLEGWVNAHRNAVAKHLSTGEDLLSLLKKEWLAWAELNLLSMYGAPDILFKLSAAVRHAIDFEIPFVQEIKEEIKDHIYNFICEQAFGMSYEELQQQITPAMLSTLINDPVTYNKIVAECGHIPPVNQFAPNANPIFLNSIVFSKIALMPIDEQKRLAQACGVNFSTGQAPLPYHALCIDGSGQYKYGEVMKGLTQALLNMNVLRHFDVPRVKNQEPLPEQDTKKASVVGNLKSVSIKVKTADKLGAGTNADIYFGLRYTDGTTTEWLLDHAYYDDLERNDFDWYHFFSGMPNKKQTDITSVYLRMANTTGAGPNWNCEKIQVCVNGGVLKTYTVNRIFDHAGETWTKTVTF